MTLARSAGRISSSAASRCVAPWVSSGALRPSTSFHSTTWVWPRRPNRLDPSWRATRERYQSRFRACSIATSYTVPTTPESRTVTLRSSIWPNTSVSVERCSKRRMFTTPVVITWPLSTWVTRVIGTNTERRPNTSTTRPSTRGCWGPVRSATTRSRTLPTWSPCGSKTGRPASRAAKTRFGVVLTCRYVSGRTRPIVATASPGGCTKCSAMTSSTCSPTGPSPGTSSRSCTAPRS